MNVLDRLTQILSNALEFQSVMLFSISFVGSALIMLIYNYFDLKFTQINRQVRRQIKVDREASQFDNLFEEWRENWKEKVKIKLDRAGILFTPQEYVSMALIAMGIGGLYGFLFDPFSSIAGNNYFLEVFGRFAAIGIFAYFGVFVPRFWVHVLITRKQSALKMQITDALLNIADALKSGLIINEAIRTVGEQMPYPIGNEFQKTANEIDTGKSLSDALYDLKMRIDLEDFSLAINAIEISFETGGKLEQLLRGIVDTIAEREAMRREMEKSIAASKGTGYILLIAPLSLAALFALANKDTYSQLLTNPTGIIMMAAAAACYAVGAFIIFGILNSLRKE